jgi:hypothetical protein
VQSTLWQDCTGGIALMTLMALYKGFALMHVQYVLLCHALCHDQPPKGLLACWCPCGFAVVSRSTCSSACKYFCAWLSAGLDQQGQLAPASCAAW